MPEWYHQVMGKRKPDTEAVRFTYDELETALVALAIRQEELRGSRSRESGNELELIWHVSDKMDMAQRNLEARMTEQLEGWLESLNRSATSDCQRPTRQSTPPEPVREPLMTRLSRLLRL